MSFFGTAVQTKPLIANGQNWEESTFSLAPTATLSLLELTVVLPEAIKLAAVKSGTSTLLADE